MADREVPEDPGRAGAPSSEPPPPRDVAALRRRVARLRPDLSARLQDCADYVLTQSDRVAFDTVAEAAAAAGVQPSALIRFCKAIGFSGFSEMQRLFRAGVAAPRPDYQSRLAALRAHGDDSPEALFADFAAAARGSIEAVIQDLDRAALAEAVRLLAGAPAAHVVGRRRAFAVATHAAYLLGKLGRAAVLHDGVGGVDTTPQIQPGDAVLAVSFAPYAPETLAFVEAARARGASVCALTDLGVSPLKTMADVVLELREEEVGGFRSFAATFCLATTLCVAIGAASGDGPSGRPRLGISD